MFCLLHGAWHDAYCWGPLTQRLRERNHRVVAPQLPFHELGRSHQDRVRPVLEALEHSDQPAVLVAHSMASTYAPLVAAAGHVALVIHLCGRLGFLVPPVGAPQAFRSSVPFPAEGPDGTTAWDPETAMRALYRRLPADIRRQLAERLRPLAPVMGKYPSHTSNAANAVVYTADDEIFEPAWQRHMAKEVLGVEAIELPGGHFPMLEHPHSLTAVLERLAIGGARSP